MRWIVLPVICAPVTTSDIGTVSTTDVGVAVTILEVIIDRDVVTTPSGTPPPAAATATTTPKRPHHHAYAEANSRRCGDGACRVRRIIHRRIGVHRCAVHRSRVVTRYINYLRVGRLDLDDGFGLDGLYLDFLLLGGFQLASVLGFLPHPLDRIHHITLLIEERVAQVRSPLDVVVQQ